MRENFQIYCFTDLQEQVNKFLKGKTSTIIACAKELYKN